MNILLDTHIILWWLANDSHLSNASREIIANTKNSIYVSAASAWEISIKKSLGKLDAPDDFEITLLSNGFLPLPITISHAQLAGFLPKHHEDPFDRMLIAQSKIEKFTLLTHDKHLALYEAKIKLN